MIFHRQNLILMYHSIIETPADIPPNREEGAELYDVNVNTFRQQIQWLKEAGYTTSLDPKESPQTVVITFDDGELNNLTRALPALKEAGYQTYFFIIGKRVGLKGYMDWPEITKLHQEGMVIGSHGLSHEILTNLLPTQAEEELRASKVYLERNLDITVDSLSIPRGFCNDDIIAMAYRLGYKKIFVSDKPEKITQSCFGRVAVKGTWDLKRFMMACNGQTPRQEIIFNSIKNAAKFILREEGYNQVRKILVKGFK